MSEWHKNWPKLGGHLKQATAELYRAYPEDPDASSLYALAHLAVAPADQVSLEHASRSARVLQGVLARYPGHPGAMHYLIHANDAPGRERQRLDVTARYEEIAPDNPHALHMPTHIYTRLGDWEGVVRGNERAAEAALRHPAGEVGELVSDEFPHTIEYLVYAYLQRGQDSQAATQASRLDAAAPLQPGFKTAFHLASIPARFALERRDWVAASQLPVRTPAFLDSDRFAWPEAVTWFARGLGSVHVGDLDRAGEASLRLSELESVAGDAGEELFARNIRVLRLSLDAWRAHARQDRESSEGLLREAISVEASTPKHAVTPGPTLPATELLGDLLQHNADQTQHLPPTERRSKLTHAASTVCWGLRGRHVRWMTPGSHGASTTTSSPSLRVESAPSSKRHSPLFRPGEVGGS